MEEVATTVTIQPKSTVVGILLALIFGGFGLLYASTVGGLIMSALEVIVIIVTFITFGVGCFLFPPVHVISVIWAILAIRKYNNQQ